MTDSTRYEPFVTSQLGGGAAAFMAVLLIGCPTPDDEGSSTATTTSTDAGGEVTEAACIEPTFVDGLPDAWRPCGCGSGPWADACPAETFACIFQNDGQEWPHTIGGTCLERCRRGESCAPFDRFAVVCVPFDLTGLCAIKCADDNDCPEGQSCGVNAPIPGICLHNFSPGG